MYVARAKARTAAQERKEGLPKNATESRGPGLVQGPARSLTGKAGLSAQAKPQRSINEVL